MIDIISDCNHDMPSPQHPTIAGWMIDPPNVTGMSNIVEKIHSPGIISTTIQHTNQKANR